MIGSVLVLIIGVLLIVSLYLLVSVVVKVELFLVGVCVLGVGLFYVIIVLLFGGMVEYVVLWVKSIGYEVWFFYYVLGCVFVLLFCYLWMFDLKCVLCIDEV